jgi:S-formylglutathione hydrolase FrmB
MRSVNLRQASFLIPAFMLSSQSWGCSSVSVSPATTPTETEAAPSATPAATLPAVIGSPTPQAPACLSLPGTLGRDSLETTQPPQEFIFYLPPCYFEFQTNRYPVVYLLHGQTYTDEQWVRVGAVAAADRLITSGETDPFIMVLPDDRYWNAVAGPGFGDRLLALIPHIDETYRTEADREHRSLGGLSRGAGWAARLGFTHPDLFGSIGLHSPAIFKQDGPYLHAWIESIPEDERPRLWLDIGDWDTELGDGNLLTEYLAQVGYPHEFHLYNGDHSENYWSLHVEEYLSWYAHGWQNPESGSQPGLEEGPSS